MSKILQTRLPFDPHAMKQMPGIQALDPSMWLIVDDAYAAQMGERLRLLTDHPDSVLAVSDDAKDAVDELLDEVVAHLERDHEGFKIHGSSMACPDGRSVSLRGDPLQVLGRLVQNDFAVMQKLEGSDEHVLTAAVLCFPANWRLSEKFLRPLTTIHRPVDGYDGELARRVQRLFDGVRVGRPMWRNNALWYDDPTLHQPHRSDGQDTATVETGLYLRSERQAIYRLPRTNAVVFGIHTFVVPKENLT